MAVFAAGQAADVTLGFELRPTVLSGSSSGSLRWNDFQRRSSTVNLRLGLEGSRQIIVRQRLVRGEGTGDPTFLDEAYLEQRGDWRIGKQYLPFGRRLLVRESVPALRADTELVFGGLPASVAAFDAGNGRPRGGSLRVGRALGFSVASGDHLGIQATTLALTGNGELGFGQGRGYRLLLGADLAWSFAGMFWQSEFVAFRNPMNPADRAFNVSAVTANLGPPASVWGFGITWTRFWDTNRDSITLEITAPAEGQLLWRPFVRWTEGTIQEAGFGAIIRF